VARLCLVLHILSSFQRLCMTFKHGTHEWTSSPRASHNKLRFLLTVFFSVMKNVTFLVFNFIYQVWLLLGRKWFIKKGELGLHQYNGAQCCMHLEKIWQLLVYIYCSDKLSRSGTACSPLI
jgi:hypothetical protein